MKKFNYGWLLKFILAAILLGVGIYMLFDEEIVFLITGAFIVLFSLIRVVPLVKTLEKEVLRTINIVEIILNLLIGGLLLYVAISGKLADGSNTVWDYVYRYALAFFFYARALVYFTSSIFFEEKTTVVKFVAHVVSITLGSIIFISKDFNPKTVSLILSIISLLGSVYLSYDGYKGYSNYRNEKIGNDDRPRKIKGERKQKEIEADLNITGDKIEEERPRIN